jgi:hypothetical protein
MTAETATADARPARPGLRGLGLGIGYDSGDEALRRFYVPALSRAVNYDRSVGYFQASALSAAAQGVSRFVAGGGRMRLLIGAELSEPERQALVGATEIPAEIASRLARELVPPDLISARRLEVLAWLASQRRLQVKVAIPVDADGRPIPPEQARPYFHEKIGILRDESGDGVAFQGSVNESDTAWTHNFESFSVYKSWDGSAPYFDEWAAKFERRWDGHIPGFMVFDLPDPAVAALLALAPLGPPSSRDPEEGPPPPPTPLLATYLAVAPRLVGADALAESTSAVTLLPHQRKVHARLAGTWPRSWLVADGVGLGKTISAGLSLRHLLLTGQITRALILAPAGVCRQWQDELFEKFGMWVPRLDRGQLHGAHPDDTRTLEPGENPYAAEPILIASSHLARRADQQNLIVAAPPLDLFVVDEAHHARRQGADLDRYRPSRLLSLLDAVEERGHTRATWLLTATPMQIHPVELVDLLRHVGLTGPLGDYQRFERYYRELAKPSDRDIDWNWLARLASGFDDPVDDADLVLLARIERTLGPVQAELIRTFGKPEGRPPGEVLDSIGVPGRRELRAWLRQRGPISRHLTRHSRQTLRHYFEQGLIDQPVPTRDVQAVPVPFRSTEEADLYEGLDDVLDRLMQAHGTRRYAGFVLTVYRRRLTSSWAAIACTIRRRLARETMLVEEDLADEADLEGMETDDGTYIDDAESVPLTEEDHEALTLYLEQLEKVPDSKFDRLWNDLSQARGEFRAVIVFTQFTDTLDYLRDRLHPAFRSHLATYTGDGGRIWDEDRAAWHKVSKDELVDALRSGRASVVLATDSASEGLNLQVASYLVNYDLPWNPMRVEQRIGRIDRIGQTRPVVTIRNYVIPGTIEEEVYDALAARIDLFSGLVGRLQPILGATEAAFARIFQAPRSERSAASRHAIDQLLTTADELDSSGIDLDPEDLLPIPPVIAPPVDLEGLRRSLVEDLGAALDEPGQPASFDPARVSRDEDRWCALATYGHPLLEPTLERYMFGSPAPGIIDSVAFAEDGGVWAAWRADRSPPVPIQTIGDLADMGEPDASGAATELALESCRRIASARAGRLAQGAGRSRERWLASIRAEFMQLVHEVVNAESALHARTGDGLVEPRMVWLDLTGDRGTAWRNARAFAQHLSLDESALVPARPPESDPRPDVELAAARLKTARRLNELIKEWKSGVAPNEA